MQENSLNRLPLEITSNIFSRLSVESVLDCKQVCRSWRDLVLFHINTTSFAYQLCFAYQHLLQQHGVGFIQQQQQTHNSSNSATMSFVLFDEEDQALYCTEYHDGNIMEEKPIYHRRRINLKLPVRMCGLVGSCNGLICLSAISNYEGLHISNNYEGYSYYTGYSPTEEPVYICNPITREFVSIPALSIDKKKSDLGVRIACGFGYHSLTNEYKVVRVTYIGVSYDLPSREIKDFAPSRGLVEIYTLGSGSEWRIAGETDFFLKSNYFSGTGVYWNGSLHWLQENSGRIIAFDLANEKFHLVATPPPCRPNLYTDYRRLCVIRSCLCLVYEYYGNPKAFDLWLLKENEEDKSITSFQKNEQPCESRNWSKELSTKWTLDEDMIALDKLFALTNDGELLIRHTDEIVRYNLNTETATNIWVPKDIINWYQMVPLPHINSFVSLKALGEADVYTITGL